MMGPIGGVHKGTNPTMKIWRYVAIVLMVLSGLGACQTTQPVPPVTTADKFIPLVMNARRLEIIDNWQMPVEPPYIGHRARCPIYGGSTGICQLSMISRRRAFITSGINLSAVVTGGTGWVVWQAPSPLKTIKTIATYRQIFMVGFVPLCTPPIGPIMSQLGKNANHQLSISKQNFMPPRRVSFASLANRFC